jgi:HK97 family phage portal protein
MKIQLPAIFRSKAAPAPVSAARAGWYPIYESYSGAWQQNVVVTLNTVAANPYIFACMTLIARDIAKLRLKLVENAGGIWKEVTNAAYSPVLRRPNRFQTRNQFWESYYLSKLSRGNTYVLKIRDGRRVVTELLVLNPDLVVPLVTPSGDVYYQLSSDNMAGIEAQRVVPASEIIHDRWNTLFHPLVGLSPIFASGIAATQGLSIQNNAEAFFRNQSRPGGVLTAPGKISDETAQRLKTAFETNYTGENAGKIAVLGDGLTFTAVGVTPVDAQMVENLNWTAKAIAATFHVPLYKIGAEQVPTAGNVQTLNLEYYSQCLQSLIEDAESAMDDGLGLSGDTIGVEFDIDNLLRMDGKTTMETLGTGVGKGIMAPNEARLRVNLPPITGGESVYLQEQNYSLEALAKRDGRDDPFQKGAPAQLPAPPNEPEIDPEKAAGVLFKEAMMHAKVLLHVQS